MGIKYGASGADIVSIKYGASGQDVDQVIKDGNIYWSRSLMHESANRADAVGMGANWTNVLNTGDGGGSPYLASIFAGTIRMNIPDGLIGLNPQTSSWRWTPNVTNGDDGYIEVQIANKGSVLDEAAYSCAWRRCLNTGFTTAVGLGFFPSGVKIVRRLANANVAMQDCGSFSDGDIIRMIQTGNNHEVYREGVSVGGWNDSGATAAKGSNNRSMALTMGGTKDFLGPRRFSASFNYIECR